MHAAQALPHVLPDARLAAIQHATLLAYHDAFAASAIIALVGIGLALLIRDADAAATMRRRPTPVQAEAEPGLGIPDVAIPLDLAS